MAEIMAAGARSELAGPLVGEETLAVQVLGIIREVLEGPSLCEESKADLRRLVELYGPERALLEHLRSLRCAQEGRAA